jgi:hypothetical protein
MGQKSALSLLSWLRLNQIVYAVSLLNSLRNLGRVVNRTKTDMGTSHSYRDRFDYNAHVEVGLRSVLAGPLVSGS